MDTTDAALQIEYVPLDELVPDERNAKRHDLELLDGSLADHGMVEPPVIDERTGKLLSGHGRRTSLIARRDNGLEPPSNVRVDADGGWLVPVVKGVASKDEADAEALLLKLNRIGEQGGWHDEPLAASLERIRDASRLDGTGFDAGDISSLLERIAPADPTPPPDPKRRPKPEGPGTAELIHGDCIEVMGRQLEPDSVDAIVCDPPYGIAFMGKEWDTHGAKEFEDWCRTWGAAAMRVLKPGGHLIAFGATRTHHRLMSGLEDAGFEIRDCGVWMYRSGFPKSLDVSKALDRHAGADREEVGRKPTGLHRGSGATMKFSDAGAAGDGTVAVTAPATDEAAYWQGWGTALKPAIEPWVLARKPLSEPSVAANVMRWRTGAVNIDATRIPMSDEDRAKFARGSEAWVKMSLERTGGDRKDSDVYGEYGVPDPSEAHDAGRWPANVVTLEDDQDLRFFRASIGQVADYAKASTDEKPWDRSPSGSTFNRRCARCEKWRIDGHDPCTCDDPEWIDIGSGVSGYTCVNGHRQAFGSKTCGRCGAEVTGGNNVDGELHPTVKPIRLMRHLVRLVTPIGGRIIDPFAGTGTTGEAAILEGAHCTLIERDAKYLPLIQTRLGIDPGPVPEDA